MFTVSKWIRKLFYQLFEDHFSRVEGNFKTSFLLVKRPRTNSRQFWVQERDKIVNMSLVSNFGVSLSVVYCMRSSGPLAAKETWEEVKKLCWN